MGLGHYEGQNPLGSHHQRKNSPPDLNNSVPGSLDEKSFIISQLGSDAERLLTLSCVRG